MIHLHYDDDGAQAGERAFVLLHGFTLDHTTWSPVREALRAFGRTIAVDLIGHGQSPAPEDLAAYSMRACLDQLDDVLDRAGLKAAWAVGYSMGARTALQWAVHRPQRVQGLILESGTAGIESDRERVNRQVLDDALAGRIRKGGVKAFVEEWLEKPLFAGLKNLSQAEREANLGRRLLNRTTGLVNSLRGMGAGAMDPVWKELPKLAIPTLLLAGKNDRDYVKLAERLKALIPNSQQVVVPNAGHTIHVEQPKAWRDAVSAFLETTDQRG